MIPSILEPDGSSKEYRRNWARLIQKIYEVDPLTCPKCQGWMKILAFIEAAEVREPTAPTSAPSTQPTEAEWGEPSPPYNPGESFGSDGSLGSI